MNDTNHTTEDIALADLSERICPLRQGLVEEIARKQKDLAALRAQLAGVEMVIRECTHAKP